MELETTAKIPVESDSENSYPPKLEVVLQSGDSMIVLELRDPHREIKIDGRVLYKVLRLHLEE